MPGQSHVARAGPVLPRPVLWERGQGSHMRLPCPALHHSITSLPLPHGPRLTLSRAARTSLRRLPMHRTRRIWVGLVLLALSGGAALAAGPQLSAEQQQAADKLKAKGGSVMQLAADSDALVVNLGLAGKAVGDDELALVKTLPKVVDLDLHGTGVTDAGLANIEGMKDLTRLRLDHTKVSDAGVAHLKDWSSLVYLNLYETPVTDAGLDSLKGLKSLKRLYLWQTKVTDAGADSLHKALPDVTINRGEGMVALAAVKPPEEKKPDDKKPTDAKPDKKPDDKKPDAKKDDKKTASAGESKPDEEG